VSVYGTFTGTGVSPTEKGLFMDISMKFAGTASVDIELQMPSGDWLKIETGVVADFHRIFNSTAGQTIRLNCTAHTQNVEYAIKSGVRP
jgi:hypothetical protein